MPANTNEPGYVKELRVLLLNIDGVNEVQYAEIRGVDRVTLVVRERSARISGQVGRAMNTFMTEHPRLLLQTGDFIVK